MVKKLLREKNSYGKKQFEKNKCSKKQVEKKLIIARNDSSKKQHSIEIQSEEEINDPTLNTHIDKLNVLQ